MAQAQLDAMRKAQGKPESDPKRRKFELPPAIEETWRQTDPLRDAEIRRLTEENAKLQQRLCSIMGDQPPIKTQKYQSQALNITSNYIKVGLRARYELEKECTPERTRFEQRCLQLADQVDTLVATFFEQRGYSMEDVEVEELYKAYKVRRSKGKKD